MMRDAWRLSVGTFTALPIRPPSLVDARVARSALMLAPLAVLPLAVAVALICLAPLPHLVSAFAAVGVLALGDRALHWDGLSDVADGLTAGFDPERSLAVMRSGSSGPAGTLAVTIVVGIQAAALAASAGDVRGATAAGVMVCLARWTPAWCCVRGTRAARPDGLGAGFVGQVPRTAATGSLLLAAALAGAVTADWRGPVAVLAAAAVVLVVRHRAIARLGGVTGDVLGAAVECSFAAMLVVLCLA